jgi:DNA invertase Pin-like site-specific DNA recombinase
VRVVALYRVSTDRQEERGASLDAQRRRYHELAERHGWQTVAEFRGTESATAAARERHVLQQVLDAIRAGGADAVWCIEQSRLTRGDELEVALLMRELREREIAVWVDSTRRDLGDASDGLAFGIVSLVDAAEVRRFKERVKRGKREKARQGKVTGGAAPYGYHNPPAGDPLRGTLQVVAEEAAVVRRIFRWAADGVGQRAIAARLNAEGVPSSRGGRWCKTAVVRVLGNPVYLGTIINGAWRRDGDRGAFHFDPSHPDAIVVEGAHEPLIDAATWESASAHRGGTSTGLPGMLTGLLWVDGRRVVIDRSHGGSYYRPRDGGGAWVRRQAVDDLTWLGFAELLRHPDAVRKLVERSRAGAAVDPAAEIEAMERRRGKLVARLARLVAMRADGEIDRGEFAEQRESAARQVKRLEETIRSARRRMEAARSGSLDRALDAAAAALEEPVRAAARRRILRSIVERVDVTIAATGQQPKSKLGRFKSSPKWRVDDVHLSLRGGPGLDTTCSDCDRSVVTVQVVRGGRVLSFMEVQSIEQAGRSA